MERDKGVIMLNSVKHDAMNDALGTRMYRPTLFDLGTQLGVSVQQHALAVFTPLPTV
jgi:hypothetical protein